MLRIDSKETGDGSTRLLVASGEIDLDSAPRLSEAIRHAQRGARRLVIELSGVEYIDSSGVAVLIQGLKNARRQAIDYVLRDPSPQVCSVIELSQLRGFFPIERSEPPPEETP